MSLERDPRFRRTHVKKILVVDDSETVRQQLRLVLDPAGYGVVEAFDGQDGLEKAKGATDISMIICDVNMPRMNGLDMISQLKASGSSIPIVMLTTEGQPALIKRAKEAGAKGWIVKPFKPELLLAAVKSSQRETTGNQIERPTRRDPPRGRGCHHDRAL